MGSGRFGRGAVRARLAWYRGSGGAFFADRAPGLFGFHGITGFQPGVQATLEGIDAIEAIFPEYLGRTGTGGFTMSGAVGHDGAVAGHLVEMLTDLAEVEADRPLDFHVGIIPGIRAAGI